MDIRYEKLLLSSSDLRRGLALPDGSLLWIRQQGTEWCLVDDHGTHALPTEPANEDAGLITCGQWLYLLTRQGTASAILRTPVPTLSGGACIDWSTVLDLPDGVIGWVDASPEPLAAVRFGHGDGARISLGWTDAAATWRPVADCATPGALAPTAVRTRQGIHISWCDVGRRLWYACVAADLSGWDHLPQQIHAAARQPALGAVGDDVLLAFESDDGDVGYAVLRDGHVEALHDAIIPRHVDSPLRRDVKGCPRLQTDPDGDLWLWMVDSSRRSVIGCRWLGDGWSQLQPWGRLRVPALRGDHTRTGIDRIDVPAQTFSWPTPVQAHAEAPANLTRVLPVASAPRPLQPGSKLLFVEDRCISRWTGLMRAPEAARPHDGNPVLDLGAVGHFDCERVFDSGTVLHDGGRFRMWYAARGALDADPRWWRSTRLGYAESEDGFTWRRVDCGRQPAPDQNMLPGMTSYMVSVLRDDTDPDPSRRYKQLEVFNIIHERELIADGTLKPGGGGYHGRLWISADGLQWRSQPIRVRPGAAQYRSIVPTSLLLDPEDVQHRYKAYCYTSLTRSSRAVALLTSPDGIDWSFDEANPVIDPEDRGQPWQPAGPVSHVHDVAVFRAGADYLAIYQYIRHPIRLDLELAVSDTGRGFRCPFADHAVIPRGGAGSWDRGIMSPSAPVTLTDRTLLYYGANDYGHETDEPLDPAREGQLSFRPGVAELRVDGWACVRLQEDRVDGMLTTVPLRARQPLQVHINADCRGGRLLVQIVDAVSGAPVDGMSFDACQPLQQDDLQMQPVWDNSVGRIPADRPVRVQLRLTRDTGSPRVYAVNFR